MDKQKLEKARKIVKTIELFEKYEKLIEDGKVEEIRVRNPKTGRINTLKRADMIKHFSSYGNGSVHDIFASTHEKLKDFILEAMMLVADEFKKI